MLKAQTQSISRTDEKPKRPYKNLPLNLGGTALMVSTADLKQAAELILETGTNGKSGWIVTLNWQMVAKAVTQTPLARPLVPPGMKLPIIQGWTRRAGETNAF